MQRHGRMRAWRKKARRDDLYGVVVGDQHRQAGIADPLQEFAVAPVEPGAGVVQEVRIRGFRELQDHIREAGIDAHHVALLDGDLVGLQHPHQVVVADGLSLAPIVRVQVDHDAAALRPVLGEVLDAERQRLGAFVLRPAFRAVLLLRGLDVLLGAKAVVEHHFRRAVAIGVEEAPHMREAVPLGGVLQGHQHYVVADDVGHIRVVLGHRVAEVLHARALARIAHRRELPRRQPARVQHVAAGIVERQRQAERETFLHLGDALQHLLAGNVIHPPALVVRAEFAPVGTGRALLPALGHTVLPRNSFASATRR